MLIAPGHRGLMAAGRGLELCGHEPFPDLRLTADGERQTHSPDPSWGLLLPARTDVPELSRRPLPQRCVPSQERARDKQLQAGRARGSAPRCSWAPESSGKAEGKRNTF